MKEDSITIMIPALNEENNIEAAITTVSAIASRCTSDYEIIVIDDGSSDKTRVIADAIAKKNTAIRVICHSRNTGLGSCFQDAIGQASKTYFCGYPGDGDVSSQSFARLLALRHPNTAIFPYLSNQKDRPIVRRVMSKLYTKLLTVLFGVKLRYFNGYFLAETAVLRRLLPLLSTSHTVHAEIVIRLIQSGQSYREIPFLHVRKERVKTNVFTPTNIYRLARNLIRLYIDIRMKKHYT